MLVCVEIFSGNIEVDIAVGSTLVVDSGERVNEGVAVRMEVSAEVKVGFGIIGLIFLVWSK